jgi:hypothetical protein
MIPDLRQRMISGVCVEHTVIVRLRIMERLCTAGWHQ